ncbi:MAG: hypothetical protein IKM04_02525 [Clostridia bacterium]|nr:hypothetical protein [Clostridia bacterium]
MTIEEIKSCCFFGSRDLVIDPELYKSAALEVLYAATNNCRTFYFCDETVFDRTVYNAVTAAKKLRPDLDIKRVFCHFGEKQYGNNGLIINGREYEDCICIKEQTGSTLARIKALVDISDGIILYAEGCHDPTPYSILEYAVSSDKFVINIPTA